ncbi:MAG: PilZ domain-containing protein [Myxococcales bacterium]|nr:PilZ domain-containing protein [Myxococcales bacterium]
MPAPGWSIVTDRRIAERVPVRLTATYRSVHGAIHGVVTDLSRHGLFFAGLHTEDIGTAGVVEVHLRDRQLVLRGRVARHDPGPHGGLGFSFDDLEDHARRQIANIVLSAHSSR